MPDKRIAMNAHERLAWRRLVEFGAKQIALGGKPALDLRELRKTVGRSENEWSDMLGAILAVAGRSGAVRRHVDRRGQPVFVVTDEEPVPAGKRRYLWCGKVKRESEFYDQGGERRGKLARHCKDCHNERVRAGRNAQRTREKNQRYRDEHPEVARAHAIVQAELRAGRIVRPENCEKCGRRSKRIEAHHDDYSKPRDVRWLCPACHAAEHVALKQGVAA